MMFYLFLLSGIMEKEYETIKLHATLMNTTFKHDYHAKFKEKFNASEILKVRTLSYLYKLNMYALVEKANEIKINNIYFILGL